MQKKSSVYCVKPLSSHPGDLFEMLYKHTEAHCTM